jgi:hypothetical protein
MAVGASVLTHLLLLWAVMPRAPAPQVEGGVMSASLFDGEAFAEASAASSASRPSTERKPDPVQVEPDIEPLPISDTLPPLDETAEPVELGEAVSAKVAAAASAASGSSGDPCALGEWLQAALKDDPAVQAALSNVPASARSVANAVMLWNGQWFSPPPSAAQGLASIRALVVAGIASAPEGCRSQAITGPILITVGEAMAPTVLAVGSGEWRWQDLLESSNQMQ